MLAASLRNPYLQKEVRNVSYLFENWKLQELGMPAYACMSARPLRIVQYPNDHLTKKVSFSFRHFLCRQAHFEPEFLDDCPCQHLIL